MRVADRLQAAWYARRVTPLARTLQPLAIAFAAGAAVRRGLYRAGIFRSERLPVPVVVVGNVAVGGAGKTPIVRALASALAARGWRPGIVSRGYGGSNTAARAVVPGDDPQVVGDEPLMLAADGFPVWIGHRRADAARRLIAANQACNVIIADDGLQHYALARTVEIAVVDGERHLGNGLLLPAGPLREPASRLASVDAVVRVLDGDAMVPGARNGYTAEIESLPWRNLLRADAIADPASWHGGEVHAIAGIGNPRRFFARLRALGLAPVCHPFPDHHAYTQDELAFPEAKVILMTEKDAVKCVAFADARCWYLPVRARVDSRFIDLVEEKLRGSQAA